MRRRKYLFAVGGLGTVGLAGRLGVGDNAAATDEPDADELF